MTKLQIQTKKIFFF